MTVAVNTHAEWHPLREVVVGIATGYLAIARRFGQGAG